MKKWYLSKTLWISIVIAILAALQGFVFLLPLTPIDQAFVLLIISVIVAVLRFYTTQPISNGQ
jgi:hypothetical protein